MLLVFLIASCEPRNKKSETVNSPDGKFQATITTRDVGLNAVIVSVILNALEHENDSETVYEARGHGAKVYWERNDLLIIVNCRSVIREIKSKYIKENGYEAIYIQPIIGRDLKLNGKSLCTSTR